MIRVRATALVCVVGLVSVAVDGRAQEKVLAFGDSITEGIGETVEGEQGYPTRLQRLLRDAGITGAIVENHGEGGEGTAEGLSRISSVLDEGGDFILIMEGTNDLLDGLSVESTDFNLGEMLGRARSAGVTPVLATTIPFKPTPTPVGDFELAKLVRQRAVSSGVGLADQYAAFDLIPDAWPDLYNTSLAPDPVGHPNGAGYDVVAQKFADVLLGVDATPPVIGDVSPPDGSSNVSGTTQIRVVVFDHGDGIDATSTRLLVNGSAVNAQRGGNAAKSVYQFTPTEPLEGVIRVEVDAVDQAVPPNRALILATTYSTVGTSFFRGDINRDGRVDGFDLLSLAFSFGKRLGNARYLPENDLDNNGRVDGADLAILASDFGKTSV